MRIISADDIHKALTYRTLIEALAEAFRSDMVVPVRHHHTIPQDGADATLLLMPAWNQGEERFIGCKIVTVFPDNAMAQRPSVYGQYLLLSGKTGEPLAMMDGRALTAWRTACASALAARYLAREDASHLIMVGAGALAPHLIRAHASVRPIKRVSIWNRTKARAISLGFGVAVAGIEVDIAEDLEQAVGEADDQAVKRARIFVDTRAGAAKEAGDIVVPLKKKIIDAKAIKGDLFDLVGGKVKGRTSDAQITLFKSVGNALEDLAAAMLVWKMLSA